MYAELIALLKTPPKSASSNEPTIEAAYFNLSVPHNSKQLVAIYKLLSPDTLLKHFNPNDANTLNKDFYAELLYILGLEEVKSKGKKLIQRATKPQHASLYENTARNLKMDGHAQDFEVIIRLIIVWMNRILFLKLLESQLTKWNEESKYKFLNIQTIHDFDKMKIFFFDILSNKPHQRDHKEYEHIPYLNSSLFEKNEIEKHYIDISSLEDDCPLPYYAKTILKNPNGKRKTGEINMLEYLFEFLDAYDFASEGSDEVVSESKTLINASVLGLIFEKLNGYKDGSFYTPSFITMNMSKETITKAIIEKFNQTKGWNCATLDDLDEQIEDKREANEIIDSLTICDPAVGSGHFLVSSLNTILEIKSQLRILFDSDGRRIKDYELNVENDELIVRDDEGEIFEYKRNSKEKTRIQKMLFNEKQKIIERSLFGVDINPNSAQITRLRLWIELLKNSYYDESGSLVTMPNIDINIKVGNSLVSRYGLHDEITIPNIKHAIEEYKHIVRDYKEGYFLVSKEEIRTAIDDLKAKFGLTLQAQWKQTQTYKKVLGEYVKEYGMDDLKRDIQLDALNFNYRFHGVLFGDDELTDTKKKEKTKLLDKVLKAYKAIEEIEKGKIYEDAFEWRFEFPEVLDGEGNFVGFDVVIGNPPYIMEDDNKEAFNGLHDMPCYQGKTDIWHMFTCKAIDLLRDDGFLSFIAKNQWLDSASASNMRRKLYDTASILSIVDFGTNMVFEEASQQTMIMLAQKNTAKEAHTISYLKFTQKAPLDTIASCLGSSVCDTEVKRGTKELPRDYSEKENLTFSSQESETILHKIESKRNFQFDEKREIIQGIIGGPDKAFIISADELDRFNEEEKHFFKMLHTNTGRYYTPNTDQCIAYLHKGNIDDIDAYPNIKSMLSPYRSYEEKGKQKGLVYRREVEHGRIQWFHLWWARDENFFKEGAKIVWAKRTYGERFTYTEKPFYGTANLFFIKSERVDLKYVTALLNSKLFSFYMHERLKHTGDLLQIDKNQFMKIPLYIPEDTAPFSYLVDRIITLKKQNKDTADLEVRIDAMVYELYGLSDEEIAVVEGNGKV